jgi:hypothetical protein
MFDAVQKNSSNFTSKNLPLPVASGTLRLSTFRPATYPTKINTPVPGQARFAFAGVSLRLLGCLVGFATGSGKLIAAGSRASVAGDAADFLLNLLNGKTLDELRNRLKIAVAAAGELYIMHDVAL